MTAGPAAAPQPPDDPPDPVFPDVQDWVEQHFLPIYARPIGGEFRWCARWWLHPEAIIRFKALWQSWEAMRLQPGTGTASWLRDHLDHQVPVLLGRTGPFAQCRPDEHIAPRTAAADPPPDDWWEPRPGHGSAPGDPPPEPGETASPMPGPQPDQPVPPPDPPRGTGDPAAAERHPRSLNVKPRPKIEGGFPGAPRQWPRRRGCRS